jgi:hypothetical protein
MLAARHCFLHLNHPGSDAVAHLRIVSQGVV